MTRVGTGLLLLLLVAGCASKPVLYRHPTTGEYSACSRRAAQTSSEPSLGLMFGSVPILGLVGYAVDGAAWAIDSATAGNRYADCKTSLEERGFVRDDP